MKNDFEVEGMDKARKLLLIHSTLPKDKFKADGSMHGNQFGLNRNTFKYAKLSLMRMTGMTEEEYNKWEKQYEPHE